jgi:hypothetical protein
MLCVYPVAKVGVALRPPCPQKRNISPRRCLNPLRFLVFDSGTADEPEKSHAPLTKTSSTTGWNSKLSTLDDLCTLPSGKTRYPLNGRMGRPQGQSGQVRKNWLPPGFDPRTVQPVGSRYTDCATRPTDGN